MSTGPAYRLVLPHGWARVPLRAGTEERVEALVRDALRDAPRDLPPDRLATVRRQLEGQLLAAVRTARESGGVDLYLPVATTHGATIPATFVVGQVPGDDGEPPSPAQVVAAVVASDPSARTLELGPHLAVRTESDVGGAADRSEGASVLQADSRRVNYLLPTPDGRGWATVSFSTLAFTDGGVDMTPVVVELFDAIMTTFRWSEP